MAIDPVDANIVLRGPDNMDGVASDEAQLPKFSSELVDIFIDYLHNDQQALFACSLVCKSWLPGARFHAFETVNLTPLNMGGFMKLFRSPTKATIIPFIRHFDYDYEQRGPDRNFRFFLPAHGSRLALRVQSSFIEILYRLPTLPGVVSLNLRAVNLEWGPPFLSTTFPNLLAFKSTDVQVTMESFIGPSHPLMINTEFLDRFPLRRRLFAADVASVFGEYASEQWRQYPSSLQSLTMRPSICGLRMLYLSLSAHPQPPRLTSMDLSFVFWSDYEAGLALIRHFGHDLVSLVLGESDYQPDRLPPGFRDLETYFGNPICYRDLRKLESLQVCPALGHGDVKNCLWNMLSALQHPLTHLKLGIDVPYSEVPLGVDSALDPGDWDRLFEILRQPHFAQLMDVTVLINPYERRKEEVMGMVRERFRNQGFGFILEFGVQPPRKTIFGD